MTSTIRLLGFLICLPLVSSTAAAQIHVDDSATTPTCIPYTLGAPSIASPPDGAVYRVGEPVLVETDPYFATLPFCQSTATGPIVSVRSVSRSIDQAGVSGVIGQSDPTEVLHFNVPGTVVITREAHHVFLGPWAKTVNTITIIDDGPRPFPEPVSAPPGEKVPRIEWSPWFGNPLVPVTGSVLTRDGTVSILTGAQLRNTGDADLVIMGFYHWIGTSHNAVTVKNVPVPAVIRPGGQLFLDFDQVVNDWDAYEATGAAGLKFQTLIVESNAANQPFLPVSSALRRIFDTMDDIPSNFVFPPPIPRNIDPTVCNDTNNDGVIDVGDIVTSILRSAP